MEVAMSERIKMDVVTALTLAAATLMKSEDPEERRALRQRIKLLEEQRIKEARAARKTKSDALREGRRARKTAKKAKQK